MKKILIFSIALGLTGCAGLDTVREYKGQPVTKVEFKGVNYRVSQHPVNQSIRIKGSDGQAVQSGLIFGGKAVPDSYFKQVAIKHLKETKPNCKVDGVYEIMNLEYEAIYSCK